MTDNKFESAFKAAQRGAAKPISELDLLIIDQVYNVCDRINQIAGFDAQIHSVTEMADEFSNRLLFRFSVSFNNLSGEFSINAEKGKYAKDAPTYSVRQGFMGETKPIRLDTDADIETVLLTIVRTLGQGAAETQRSESLKDALARRRLIGKMPDFKL